MLMNIAIDAGVMDAESKAKFIFSHYSGLTSEDIYRFGDDYDLVPWRYAQMVRAMNRLIGGTPVQHIMGYTHFYDETFICKPGVLVPRPETETLVDYAIAEISSRGK